MKKFTLPVLGALALTLTCSSVFAVDGTITVNGVITDETCTLHARGDVEAGLKDITVNLPAISKSMFTPTNTTTSWRTTMDLYLKNATGTAPCDVATSVAFKGIHLSVTSPATDLDTEDKTLLVNKATGAGEASAKNPVFIQISTWDDKVVDLSAPRETQERSIPGNAGGLLMYVHYGVRYVSKTGIVDAQNVNAVLNYTLHYN